MSLKTEVYSLLNKSARLCADCVEAKPLLDSITDMKTRLDAPLRVAVVGIMKAGKSTFMNALMGKDILDTGALETTYTVGWFRYAKTPRLTICFRDGTQTDAPFENLAKWSVRVAEKENSRLNDVKYVIIYYPSEVLKKMEFIDTPGLNSIYGTDAQNTLDFLSLKSSEDTLTEASQADAVIYAFSRSAGGFDKGVLSSFHDGDSSSSPINSIGILTKVDISGIWDIFGTQTPVETAATVADTVMKNPDIQRQLFSVFPVCAKTVEGCSKLEAGEWDALKALSEFDTDELVDYLYDAEMFANSDDEDYNRFGAAQTRSALISNIGQYGVLEAAKQFKEGKTPGEITAVLQEKCGVNAVRAILANHFGNRTFLIKSRYIFNYLKAVMHKLSKGAQPNSRLRQICDKIREDIDELMTSHQTLNELKILQMYYNGQLTFDYEDEKEDFLRVTGEYGRNAEARLGLPKGSTISQLKNEARKKVEQWHYNASRWMMSNTYVTAASIIARSYEHMFYHLSSLDEE